MAVRLAVCSSALLAASCGLLAPGDPPFVPPSDGVSGFGAAEPVELCLGQARVVSPAAAAGAAGALCVPAEGESRLCDADAQCDGIERCLCGRCIVQACDGGSCRPGEVCRGKRCTRACADAADCLSGERCLSGGCARACSDDAACHHGERCDSLDDACTTKTCGGGISCGPGEACEPIEQTGEVREPEVALVSALSVAFVEIRRPDGKAAIHRARVAGEARWVADPLSPVLAGDAGAPSVLARGGALELYFAIGAGEGIGRAVSTDGGAHFTADPALLLAPAQAWEAGRVGSPAAVVYRGETLLAYEGGRGAGIGLARVTPAGAERIGEGPIARPEDLENALFWRGVSAIGAPYAIVHDDILRIYVTGRGVEGSDAVTPSGSLPADANDSIGLLATTDLRTFSAFPAGPVHARLANLRAYLGEREASVRLVPRGAEMYFIATDAAGEETAGLSRASTWEP